MKFTSFVSLACLTLFLSACSKPFPIEDSIYDEYKAIACKIPTGQVTPEILSRQIELNGIFEKRLKVDGSPNSDWIQIHAKKFAAALDLKTCDSVKTQINSPSTDVVSGSVKASNVSRFDGVWFFNEKKSREANTTSDDMEKAIIDGTMTGVAIATLNSAGMKIQSGRVQDGDTYCTLEAGGADISVPVDCVDQRDRSISGKYSLVPSGELQVITLNKINLIFDKR
jgi:hypothetical protein